MESSDKKKSLFVCIANYKDTEVISTVRSLIDNASGVFDMKICVFSQIDLADTSFDELDNIPEVLHIRYDYRNSRGACWARKMCQSYYTDEEFYLQVDAHMLFAENWDSILFKDYNMALNYGTKAIISVYPPLYEKNDDGERVIPYKMAGHFNLSLTEQNSIRVYAINTPDTESPREEFYIAAGFLFSIGDIVKEVPYDEEIFFHGEEISLAVRAYSAGYRIFSTTTFICAHYYHGASKSNAQIRPLFWDAEDEKQRKTSYVMRDNTSKLKVKHICNGQWFGTYGIADYRLYAEFRDRLKVRYPGIDIRKVNL
jgi:hypothetical protein